MHDATVDAVVVNHDGGDRIVRCVQALLASDPAPARVIVVDNASTDGSRERVAALPGVQVLAMPSNDGPTTARNAGLAIASAPRVLVLDDDVYVEPGTLGRLADTLHATGAAAVVPRVLLYPGGDTVQCDGASVHFVGTMALRNAYRPMADAAPAEAPFQVGACISACLLVDRDKVLGCGGFDELFFFYFEDLEFSLRLRVQGHDIVCDPTTVVHHDRGRGTPGLSFRGGPYPARRAHLSQRNRWLMMLIHFRLRTFVVLAPMLLLYEIASMAFFASRGWLREWARAWAWLWRNAPQIATRRARSAAGRCRRDVDLIEGGRLPLAPDLVSNRAVRAGIGLLSRLAAGYWVAARHLTG